MSTASAIPQGDKNKDKHASEDVFDAAIARFDQLVSKANALIRKAPDVEKSAGVAPPRPSKRKVQDAKCECSLEECTGCADCYCDDDRTDCTCIRCNKFDDAKVKVKVEANGPIRKTPDAAPPPAAGAEKTTDTNPRPRKRSKYMSNPNYPYGSFPSTDDDYLNFYLPPLRRGYESQEIPVPLQRSAKQEEAIKAIEPQMPEFTAEIRPNVRAFFEYMQRDAVRVLTAKSSTFENNDSYCAMYRQLKTYSAKLGFSDCFPLGKECLTKTKVSTRNEGTCGHSDDCDYPTFTAPPSVTWQEWDWQVVSQIYDWIMSHSTWTSRYHPHLVVGLHPKTNIDHGLGSSCNADDYFYSLVDNCAVHCKWYNTLSIAGKHNHGLSHQDAGDLHKELVEIEKGDNDSDNEHGDDDDAEGDDDPECSCEDDECVGDCDSCPCDGGTCKCRNCQEDDDDDGDDDGDDDYNRDNEDADDEVKTWKGKGKKVKATKATTTKTSAREAARLKTWRRLDAPESNDGDDDVVTDSKQTQKTSSSSKSARASSSSKTTSSKKKHVSRRERLGL